MRRYQLHLTASGVGVRKRMIIRVEQGKDRYDRAEATEPKPLSQPCPCCGGRMIVIETFLRGSSPRYRLAASTAVIRVATS